MCSLLHVFFARWIIWIESAHCLCSHQRAHLQILMGIVAIVIKRKSVLNNLWCEKSHHWSLMAPKQKQFVYLWYGDCWGKLQGKSMEADLPRCRSYSSKQLCYRGRCCVRLWLLICLQLCHLFQPAHILLPPSPVRGQCPCLWCNCTCNCFLT